MIETQSIFLKIFAENQENKRRRCLLVEGGKPGCKLNREMLPGFEDIPESIEIQGSDIRANDYDPDEYFSVCRYLQAKKEQKIEMRKIVRQAAQILNAQYAAHQATLQGNAVLIDAVTYESLRKLVCEFEQCEKSINEIKAHSTELEEKDQAAQIRESNHGLVQCAVEVLKSFDQIFAFWGKAHFTNDLEFYEELKRANISSIVLLPNKKLETRIKKESKWSHEKIKICELPLIKEEKCDEKIKKTTFKFPIPENFRSFFHPLIQNLVTSKTCQAPSTLIATPNLPKSL